MYQGKLHAELQTNQRHLPRRHNSALPWRDPRLLTTSGFNLGSALVTISFAGVTRLQLLLAADMNSLSLYCLLTGVAALVNISSSSGKDVIVEDCERIHPVVVILQFVDFGRDWLSTTLLVIK